MRLRTARIRAATMLVAALPALFLALPARAADHLKVGTSHISGYAGVPVALARGYFAAQDIEVEMVFFDSSQPISVGVASGDIDLGVSGSSAGFYTLAAQGQLRILASSAGEMPGFDGMLAVAGEKAWRAGLQSPKDLPGHTIGITQIGTALHYTIGLMAEKYGFPMSAVAVKPLQSNFNVLSALLGGTVDAAVMPVSPVQPALTKGDIHTLVEMSALWHHSAGSVLFTSTKIANERGDVLRRFLIAYRQGMKDFHDAFTAPDGQRRDGPLAPAILPIMADFARVTPEEFDHTTPYADAQGRIETADMDRQIAWYRAQGLMKADIRVADIVDARYAILMPQDETTTAK